MAMEPGCAKTNPARTLPRTATRSELKNEVPAVRPGASLVSETLPPLLRLTPVVCARLLTSDLSGIAAAGAP